MTKLIILRGYPGSGKTTIGKQLQTSKLGEFIDHNAILTFLAGIVGNDDGIYDEIAQLELAMCKKLLAEGKSTIVARGFSSLSSVDAYTQVARELHINTIILRLEVGESELLRRVHSPERQLDFNPTIDASHARSWMANNPIESHPDEIVIDNEKPIHEVVQNIAAVLELD